MCPKLDLLGAAGALEATFTVMSLIDQRLPPTANLSNPEDLGSEERRVYLSHVLGSPLTPTGCLDCAISNSFGFGGTNASLLFCRDTDA